MQLLCNFSPQLSTLTTDNPFIKSPETRCAYFEDIFFFFTDLSLYTNPHLHFLSQSDACNNQCKIQSPTIQQKQAEYHYIQEAGNRKCMALHKAAHNRDISINRKALLLYLNK